MALRSFFKYIITLLFFSSWKVLAVCSDFAGDATINEIYKQGGNNGDVFIELALISPAVASDPSISNNWTVRICHPVGNGRNVQNACDDISVEDMNFNTNWRWTNQTNLDRDFVNFKDGFDLALLDTNGNFIDYIQIDNYSGQGFGASCTYDDLPYAFDIPASTTNGTQILLRKPNGTGSWVEDKNTNKYPSTPGESNDDEVATVVHHYQIVHDGQGLTCEAESVTINACADAACTLISQPVTLDFLANAAFISSAAFTGSTTITFNNTTPETLTFSLANTSIAATNPLVCRDGGGNSCNMAFTSAGFRFLSGAGNSLSIPNQTSGLAFADTLKLQAVKDVDGVCSGLFTGNTNVDLSQENIAPGDVNGLSFSVNGNDIAKHTNVSNILLNFEADSIATIPLPLYNDAGQIRLHANYDVGGVTLTGSSNAFWVSPAELVVRASSGATDLNGSTSTASTVHAAGSSFDLSVTALNSLGVITPNYFPGQIQLQVTRTGPTLTNSVDGVLNYAGSGLLTSSTAPVFQNVTLTNFSSGVSTYNGAYYTEVGLLNLDVQDSNYGNVNIIISAADYNVGRFIPDHFEQTVAQDGVFNVMCGMNSNFAAYSGQLDEATATVGAISYLTNPVFAITAYNSLGSITQNYYEDSAGSADDYMKLNASDINISLPTADQSALGIDANLLSITASVGMGTLSQNDLTALPSIVALPRGVLHYQLSDNDHFFYDRSANALVAPFTSDINFSVASIRDGDNVNVTNTIDISPTGLEIRFGRLLLENSFGPETSNFPQPMQIEYFDGTNFITATDDNCTAYNESNITLSNISLDPALSGVLGGIGSFIAGQTQAIELLATGAGNQGQIGVLYDINDWLKYDWDSDGEYDDNPTAVATFGLFRGNDRIIHWREVFNE